MSMEAYPPDWRQRRLTVLNRDRWTCQECGYENKPADDTSIHVHHIKPISDGGGHEYGNLESLCEDCHVAVHSNGTAPPVERAETYKCAVCGVDRRLESTYRGSYCSMTCWSRHMAEKSLNALRDAPGVCMTCFASVPGGSGQCPNCGNWDLDENRRVDLGDVDIDVENLIAHVIKAREGEL